LEVQRTRAATRGDAEVEEALGRGDRGGSDTALRSTVDVENERALYWLERAFDTHNPNLPGINNRRPFDPLRGHARFQALLRRMHLPT
jgi:hypothetical protein